MKHDDFEPLKDISCSHESMPVLVSEDDVLKRLSRLNVNKSEGPDEIRPKFPKLDIKLHTH